MRSSNPDSRYGCCCSSSSTTSTALVSYILTNVAALRAMSTTAVEDNELAQTLGYYTAGDGSGNLFYWDSDGADVDNNGSTIKPTDKGSSLGRWITL